MQTFVKAFPKIHTRLIIAGIITSLSGFSTATATGTCTESTFLLPATAYSGDYCTTTTTTFTVGDCQDEAICPTLVGLCECLAFGLRQKVQQACPLMCKLCTTTTTSTTTTSTSTTTSTTTTTTTIIICEDQIQCPTRQGTCDCFDKCEHPLVGPRLKIECPVMCNVCGSTTTTTTTTTTTSTTVLVTTIKWDPVVCEDHPSCPNRQADYIKDGTGHIVEPCNCEDKCWHPLVGPELRRNCPVMCNVCSTTTTTTSTSTTTTTTTTTTTITRTIPSVCVDDVVCPTLVDPNGKNLCLCENVGDLVRAACPVMCNVCHRCILPRLSENLASKTTLTRQLANQTTQTSTIPWADNKIGNPQVYLGQDLMADLCDDPMGIPKGHACIVKPITHPCLTQSVLLQCPKDSTTVTPVGKLQTHCQVCGGITSEPGDVDPRPGHIEVQISWGPNAFDGTIDELGVGILGYAVYALSACGEKQGGVLATVTSLGIQQGTESCCEKRMYGATIQMTLPNGGMSQSFMVVPLTSIGALDVGWVTPPIIDSTVSVNRASVAFLDGLDQSRVEAAESVPVTQDSVVQTEEGNLGMTTVSPDYVLATTKSQPTPQLGPTAEDPDSAGAPDEAQEAMDFGEMQSWLIAVLAVAFLAALAVGYAIMKRKSFEKEASLNNRSKPAAYEKRIDVSPIKASPQAEEGKHLPIEKGEQRKSFEKEASLNNGSKPAAYEKRIDVSPIKASPQTQEGKHLSIQKGAIRYE